MRIKSTKQKRPHIIQRIPKRPGKLTVVIFKSRNTKMSDILKYLHLRNKSRN